MNDAVHVQVEVVKLRDLPQELSVGDLLYPGSTLNPKPLLEGPLFGLRVGC